MTRGLLVCDFDHSPYIRPTGTAVTATSVFAIDLSRAPQRSITEVVYVIVLPTGVGIPLNLAENSRLHFSWTIDAKGTTPLGPLNLNYANILTPEPGRIALLGLAFALLIMRRARPHG